MKRIVFLVFLAAFCYAGVLYAFTATFRTDTPSGSDDPSEGDDRIREVKAAVQERLDVDHYFHASGANTYDDPNTGKHRYVRFIEPNNLTVMPANEGALFTKDVNSVAELHWINEQDQIIQLTREGIINLTSNSLLGVLANNTFFTAINKAGTGTVDLIKAGRDEDDGNDVPVLGQGARLPTAADLTEDTELVHKKYVDDLVVDLLDVHQAYVKVSDVKTNAAGGGFGASAWRTRDINTENHDASNICTIADNRITLAEGTYRCRITCPAFLVDSHCARLFNISSQTELIRGTVEFCEQSAYGEVQTRSEIVGQFSVAAAQLLEIQHYCTNSRTGDGFGVKLFSTENVYTVAEFWRIPETE